MVEYSLLLFLAIGQVLKILWYLKFNIGVNGKSETVQYLENTDRRVKWIKIWDSQSPKLLMFWYFSCLIV